MKKTIVSAIFGGCLMAACAFFAPHSQAQGLAGEWTKCVAVSHGSVYNVVNGSWDRDRCFKLGRICAGDPNAGVTYYGNAVIINAPYRRCLAH